MNHWHYQLMRHTEDDGEVWYGVHEMYILHDGPFWTEDPVRIISEDQKGIDWQLWRVLFDIVEHGVIDYG